MVEKKKQPSSALTERDGVPVPENISAEAADKVRSLRKTAPDADALAAGILNRDITSLSRAITLLESTHHDHIEKSAKIVSQCLPHSGNSVRIGITGVPGVGKSTFIEAFGKHLTGLGKRVAVLAVDPSSTISHGSILGDKTRMEELVKDPNAYIRPSASGETLGGVARKTRETITLCEAAGYDVIIIETVGVGQSETAVHGMVDFFLLLKIAGAGDELQGIKRGIMELADAVVINKADGENKKRATMTKSEFNRALHLFPAAASGWTPKASTCSAITREGIDAVWQNILDYLTLTKNNGYFTDQRNQQNRYWMIETINSELLGRFYSDPVIEPLVKEIKIAVGRQELSPFIAAHRLLEIYFKKDQSS